MDDIIQRTMTMITTLTLNTIIITRPADVLIAGWNRGKHAALDITVASPLCPAILPEASHHSGAAANGAELRKLNANSIKCMELGWTCIPMAVETFGHWGREAQSVLSRLASHLLISPPSSELQWLPTFMDVSTSSW